MKKKLFKAAGDERVLAEGGKIYRVGFWVLALGILADVLVKTALYLPGGQRDWGLFPLLGLEFLVLVLALLLCALLAAGRGILTVGADPEAEKFPAGHYALVSLGIGLGLSAASLAIRALLYPAWEFDLGALVLVFGMVIGFITAITFVLCFAAFWVMFRIAKARRKKLEE